MKNLNGRVFKTYLGINVIEIEKNIIELKSDNPKLINVKVNLNKGKIIGKGSRKWRDAIEETIREYKMMVEEG